MDIIDKANPTLSRAASILAEQFAGKGNRPTAEQREAARAIVEIVKNVAVNEMRQELERKIKSGPGLR